MKRAVFFLLTLTLAARAGAEVHPLTPSPCRDAAASIATPTLDSELQMLADAENRPRGDLVYELESGEHCVRHYSLVQHLTNVTFRGSALIKCTAGNGLAFFNMTDLWFSGVTIDGCGLQLSHMKSFISTVKMSLKFFFTLSNTTDQYVAMALGNCVNFRMDHSIVSNTEGLGLLGINIMGQSTLNNVTIEGNVPRGCFSTNNFNLDIEKVGGGAVFYYSDYITADPPSSSADISIVDSEFVGNSYCGFASPRETYYQLDQSLGFDPYLPIGAGGGLSLLLTQLQYLVNFSGNGLRFQNNTALYGGGSHVQFFTGTLGSSVVFDNCVFERNGVETTMVSIDNLVVGAALFLLKDIAQPDFPLFSSEHSSSTLIIRNSQFLNNIAYTGTVFFHSLFRTVPTENNHYVLIFENCTFEDNKAITASGIYMEEWKGTFLQMGSNILLKDVVFSHNSLYGAANIPSPSQSASLGIVVATRMNVTFSGTSSFCHNEATALAATTSSIHVLDSLTFINNSASYGGGLALSQSFLVVGENTTLAFINNTAGLSGGAIFSNYVGSPVGTASYNCFLHFIAVTLQCIGSYDERCPDITSIGVEIKFEGNKAPLGNMIYGSTLNTCSWTRLFRNKYAPGMPDVGVLELLYTNFTTNFSKNFTSPFQFDSPPHGVSAVTTPTTHIGVELPYIPEWNASVFLNMSPGIKRQLNITALDAFMQAVPTVISSTTLTRTDIISVVGDDNNFRFLSYDTSQLTNFQVFGAPNQSDIEVTLLAVASYTQVKLSVNIVDCPDGYYLSQNQTCKCSKSLLAGSFRCTEDGQLLVPYGSWVGRDRDGVVKFGHCPLDYCSAEIAIIQVNSSIVDSDVSEQSVYDVQCNSGYNRGGVGCGRCLEGYSIVLGSNRCLKCSNTFLLLLLVFAAYGVSLISLIVFFQFTISEGFLNGILFFSNILALYAPYLLTRQVRSLFVVCFWLSFKMGFETCFFDGMTALSSTALNYVFPLYLYFLLLLVTLLARWSHRFTRWMGSHRFSPSKLFATILVMTYTSLLETTVSILAFTPLKEVTTNRTSYYWSFDPSVAYFRHSHAALAVFAILLLVFFLIPAPILWLFPNRLYNSLGLQRFTPLYDAVWAPLKTNFRFWVSLRLFLRLVPLMVISFSPIPINLLLLCFFLLILLFVHGVVQPFQGVAQNILDSLFQVELIAITLLSLYFTVLDLSTNKQLSDVDDARRSNELIRETDTIQLVLVVLVVVSVYLSILVVVVWHLMLRFPKLKVLAVRGWNYVMCKRFHLKQHRKHSSTARQRLSTTIIVNDPEGEKDVYGSLRLSVPRVVPTFSELREPLLESSGLADMLDVRN